MGERTCLFPKQTQPHSRRRATRSVLTVGGGLVSSADPRVAAPVVFRPRRSVSLQQREELTAVLVQVVADGLRAFRARLGAHAVAADVVT